MNNIARAWKDETYRQSLSVEEQAMLPANPAGEIELTEAELGAISGAGWGNRPSDTDQNEVRASQNVTILSNDQEGLIPVIPINIPITFKSCNNNSQEARADFWDQN
jgi:mersacidin/lichenicidin family type 2 lantibiotic